MSKHRKIKFGVVGLGNIGSRHLQHIEKNKHAELTAICDIDKSKLTSSEPSIFATTDFTELLKKTEIDVVNVCVPNYLHKSFSIKALEAGKHVVCEKPMALSVAECDAMIKTARKAGRKIFVVKQNRYNPPIKAVKELIERGTLGEIFQVSINCFWNRNQSYYKNSDWRGKKDKDGGCLFTQFSHFVDIMYYLFGEIEEYSGVLNNYHHPYIEFEDTGIFNLRSKNGALISFNYTISAYQKNMEGSVTVIAEYGTVKIGGEYLNTIDYQRIKNHSIKNLPYSAPENDYGSYKGSMSNHDKVIQNVVETLGGKALATTGGEDGRKVVEIIEKMYAAAKYIDT